MKNIFYIGFLFISISVTAQPTFIGALAVDGPQNGGIVYKLEMPGATSSILHQFNNLFPHRPSSGVTAGDGNWLYGTLTYNGTNNLGGLFKIQRNGTGFTVLHEMSATFGSPTRPYFHTDGKIYFCDGNDLMQYDPATGNIVSISSVSSIVSRNLHIDTDDWAYMTTSFGTLVKVKTDGSNLTTLHSFNSATDGSSVIAGVTEVPGDILFGVTNFGGPLDGGTIYSIHKDGSGFTIHHQFDISNPFDPQGSQPQSKLVLFDGRLFGTTTGGGSAGVGVIYTINLDGSGYKALAEFPAGFNGIGDMPNGDISITSNARIIGAFNQFTSFPAGYRHFFKVDTSGNNFEGFGDVNQRENGHFNNTPLLINDETIFFTTQTLGRHDGGVFSQGDTSGNSSGLFHFGASPNGFKPGALIKGSDGKLYGTTVYGGPGGNGTIYSMSSNGTGYTKLYEFNDAQGYEPIGKLLEASDGKLYGALAWGGATGGGCLYRIDKDGNNFQVLYSFSDLTNGYSPFGSLVEDGSGFLYGSTNYSTFGYGVVFKMNKNGTGYTVLRDFHLPDLGYPYGGLRLHMGKLYGIGYWGGTSSYGGVFRINTDGTGYELLHSFANTDGSNPMTPPIIANDGKLYGGATNGGSQSAGTIYSMDLNGSNFSVIKHLTSSDVQYPQYGIIRANDGLIYGAGYANTGTGVFNMNTTGTSYNVIRTFDPVTEGQTGVSFFELNPLSLPVVLTKFLAQKQYEKALLSWQTAEEENSKTFDIERSGDGKTFATIGSVLARGNSNHLSDYSYIDESPLEGKNYYRLRQVDKDAKFTYSPVRALFFNKGTRIIVYPNPAVDQLQLQLPKIYSSAELHIMNSEGRLMKKMMITKSDQVEISISSFPAGKYLIRIYAKDKVETVSFIKQSR